MNKDMSEEKDEFCEDCLPSGKCYPCELNDEIKSLESRLTKYERHAFCPVHQLKPDLTVVKCLICDQEEKQRLSQAEAENKKLKEDARLLEVATDTRASNLMEIHSNDRKWCEAEFERLKARLSHLMDVAGKMAEALEKMDKEWCDFNKIESGHQCEAKVRLQAVSNRAKSALAEWDGIKDGGK